MTRYDSYILRTWRSAGPRGAQWSVRLEHVQDGELLRFSDPRLLLAHLDRLFAVTADPTTAGDRIAETTDAPEGGTVR